MGRNNQKKRGIVTHEEKLSEIAKARIMLADLKNREKNQKRLKVPIMNGYVFTARNIDTWQNYEPDIK